MLSLISCDYSYSLVVNNATGKTRHIQYIDFYRYPKGDSILSWGDTTATYSHDRTHDTFIPLYRDTVEKSVSLSLDNGRSAQIEWGINSSINPDARIIVDGVDTIYLRKDKRVRLIKPMQPCRLHTGQWKSS